MAERGAERTEGTVRILLANDTSLLGHVGSALVVRRLAELVADAGGTLVTGWGWERLDLPAIRAAGFDAVIVNGEGSIHHDSPTARRVAALGLAARDAGFPAYLVNMSEEANGPEVLAGLAAYASVHVRDGPSAASLARAGIAAAVVPDLTLSWDAAPVWQGTGRTLWVTDASDRGKSVRLHGLTRGRADARFVSLRTTPPRAADGFANRRRRWLGLRQALARMLPASAWTARTAPAHEDADALARAMCAEAAGLVTGRYHGLCIALRCGVPVVAVAGNTGKVAALLADIGLPGREIALETLLRDGLPGRVPPYDVGEAARLAAFLRHAETAARAMVAGIVSDIRDRRG
jgi:hypothetical protein